MTNPPLRKAARVIVLDADQRVLLLRYDENDGFWATPGGSLERGEDYSTAALRELHEELGIAKENVRLSAQLAERSHDHRVGRCYVRQVERYFVTHLPPCDIDPASAPQTDNIRAHRWWTLDELRSAQETVYPIELAELITVFLTSGIPDRPVVLR
ncbi:NUDIX domain-containing protein [Streptomyces sp. NPDC002589]|uniref:NUDIX hydrolase n=1 Tax=Streptomyces sp. NPDC002589 TaxID=3154420 RepID=UPI003329B649